ncbi:MAG: dTDP-4-amino-4,6-dideoxygalactose transaminase [Bacillota bacterium]|nr:dTDP-4-amino-4,6-dideoxygalactose transaminase [Bacillota bacterium]
MEVPFNKPYITGNEIKYMEECINTGKICGDGKYTKMVSELLEKTMNSKKILLTTSGTHALEMALIQLNLEEGDEVIVPSYTFVSTANAVLLRKAKLVFADIDEKTLNIDINDVKSKITKRTRAIMPVHYAGISCDMDELMKVARENNIFVIEDAAQAVYSKYKGKYLGTVGDFGCFSFHETKNYVCGEGGAISVNLDGEDSIERAEIIREKGTNRSKFYRGQVDKYTWVDIGSSYLPSDILSAFLYAQLEKRDEIYAKRKAIYENYYENLIDLQNRGILKLPVIPEFSTSNYHMFYVLCESEKQRDYLMAELKKMGITAVFHYLPLHTSPVGNRLGYDIGQLPVTEKVGATLLRLPMYASLSNDKQEYVVDSIKRILSV